MRKQIGYWNYENTFKEALKYQSRNELRKGSGSAYFAARRNGWLKDYTWFKEPRKQKPSGYWNKENVFKEAKKYSRKIEFRKGCVSAYNAAWENGWLKEMDWFEEVRKPNGYWNYESVKECASKCTHRADFKRKYEGAYNSARKNEWLNILFPINRRDKEAKIHYVYCFMFHSTNSVYVGRTVEPIKREKAHNKNGAVYRHSMENNIEIPKMQILFDRLTLDESKIKEDDMINHYRNCGYNILNKAKTGLNSSAIGSIGFGKLTRKYCFSKAKECKSRSELGKKYSTVYLKALKNKWLDDYTWFVEIIKPKGYWNVFENVEREAKKCGSRRGLEKTCRSAYNSALKHGWMDILFPVKKVA